VFKSFFCRQTVFEISPSVSVKVFSKKKRYLIIIPLQTVNVFDIFKIKINPSQSIGALHLNCLYRTPWNSSTRNTSRMDFNMCLKHTYFAYSLYLTHFQSHIWSVHRLINFRRIKVDGKQLRKYGVLLKLKMITNKF